MEDTLSWMQIGILGGVVAFTWALKKYGPVYFAFLATARATIWSAFFFSAAMEVVQALVDAAPLSPRMVLRAIFTTAVAVGLYTAPSHVLKDEPGNKDKT